MLKVSPIFQNAAPILNEPNELLIEKFPSTKLPTNVGLC